MYDKSQSLLRDISYLLSTTELDIDTKGEICQRADYIEEQMIDCRKHSFGLYVSLTSKKQKVSENYLVTISINIIIIEFACVLFSHLQK